MERAMKQLPWVSPEKLKQELQGMVDGLAEQIMASINQARAGHLIDDSEEPVREAGREFIRAAFQKALQHKIDAAEASFSPSAGHEHRSRDAATGEQADAQQRTPVATGPDGQRPVEAGAPLVARTRSRQRRAGR
jgi:hypothetical protein